MQLDIGGHLVPHPQKVEHGGEDAFFVSPLTDSFGVADGVGAWALHGINPAEYARSLMKVARAYLEGQTTNLVTPETREQALAFSEPKLLNQTSMRLPRDSISMRTLEDGTPKPDSEPRDTAELRTPQGALADAHAKTRLPGSACALVAALDAQEPVLHLANLGDCGLMHVRQDSVMFRSKPMSHFFDCPLQLAAAPEHSQVTDSASNAFTTELRVQPGDLLIAGSDGLWDNMHPHEVLAILRQHPGNADKAAAALAKAAAAHAQDGSYASPYAADAAAHGKDIPLWAKIKEGKFKKGKFSLAKLRGGKLDDVTAVVALVQQSEEAFSPTTPHVSEHRLQSSLSNRYSDG